MHPYATDSNEREILLFYLALASVLISYCIKCFFDYLHINVPFWVSIPSIFGIFGSLYLLLNMWIWKSKLLHRLRIIRVTDLNGKWVGYLKSSYNNYSTEIPVSIFIYQSWTKILIVLESETSKSTSRSATILTFNPHCSSLSYEYVNYPNPASLTTMHMHIGSTHLDIVKDNRELIGSFYSGRDRNNVGDIAVTKQVCTH